ncbi:MAG: OmpA family protein, partial [Cyclobacteriaceae bacterium]|nr:OmpA family protein [Cyclobacteriaceae bacterium]
KDIYMVEIPPHLRQFKNNILQGYIRNGDTGEGMSAELIVSDAFTSRELVHLTNNPNDGRYTVVLAVGSNYNIEVKRDGYTSQSYFFDLINKDEYEEIDQDIELYPSAKLSLNIYDVDIFEPMMANVIISEKGATSASKELVSPVDGKLELDLPLGKTYEIRIEKENFEMESFTLDVSGLVVYRDFAHDVEMMPIKRQVEINIADLTNNGKIKSRVRIRNQSRDEVILVEGNQTVALRVGDRYEIEATSDQGYAFNSTVIEVTPEGQEVKVRGEEGGRDIDLSVGIQLNLQPLVVGTDLTLKDILFDSNSDHLDEISYTELQRVVELMMENPTLRVEIDAHTDDVGSDVYNQNLSERRAESVVRFLIENKIDKGRFVARGLGESEPDFPNDTEENRAKNRRVVLKILTI